MAQKTYLVAALMLLSAACTKFDDAEKTDRDSFVHFYSSATNYLGTAAELDTDGGFIVAGEVRYENGEADALIIKTDGAGQKIWEQVIPKALINAILPTANGYILAGDSVQLNPGSLNVNELINTYARLILMNSQGSIVGQHISARTVIRSGDTLNVDYHGDALAIDGGGNIVMLGSFREPGENESSFVTAYNPSDISDSLWSKNYRSLDDNDLINAPALHITPSSTLIWASKTSNQVQNVSREFISISNVEPNSTFKSYSIYGELDARNHSVEDLQKSGVGYGAIGTYSETNGLNANMYFIRVDISGHIIPESIRYIDGEDLMINNSVLDEQSRTQSTSFDEGLAITATGDGFLLAGSMVTTPTVGNGGKDILLVKVDPFGNLLWKKLLGGSGDETVATVRETADKGFLICGTNTINGLSSIFLMKTDSNGDLDN